MQYFLRKCYDASERMHLKDKGGERMKTKAITAIMITLVIIAAASLTLVQSASQEGMFVSDHALFDTTGGDHGVKVKVLHRAFDFYLVVRAYGGPATIRITFADGDWIEFPLKAANDVISFTQAAGGTLGVDDALEVKVVSGNAVGWVSIETQKGAKADPNPPYSGSFCVTF